MNPTTVPKLADRYALGHVNIVGQHTTSEDVENVASVETPMTALLDFETSQPTTITQDLEQGRIKAIKDSISVEKNGAKRTQSKFVNKAKQQSHSMVVSILIEDIISLILLFDLFSLLFC